MKPIAYLQLHALVLAYQRVMGTRPRLRTKPAKQKRLPLFEKAEEPK